MATDVPENANEGCPGTSQQDAGYSSACQGCPNQEACQSAPKGPDPDVAAIAARLADVRRIVLVLSGKGGVGKSTVATQLAYSLAEGGQEVGLLDVDLCGPSVPKLTGLEGEEIHQSNTGWSPVYVQDNLAVMSIGFMLPDPDNAVIWRGPRKNGLIKQFLKDVDWGQLDTLLIDTPPGTSDEHISLVQLLQGTNLAGAVVVTTPQEVSIADVRKELSFCKKTNVPILGVIENMSSLQLPLNTINWIHPTTGESMTERIMLILQQHCPEAVTSMTDIPVFQSQGGATKMATQFGAPFLGKLPMDPTLGLAGERGVSVSEISADGPAALAIQRILRQLWGVGAQQTVNGHAMTVEGT